jgi:hypothetical protein
MKVLKYKHSILVCIEVQYRTIQTYNRIQYRPIHTNTGKYGMKVLT